MRRYGEEVCRRHCVVRLCWPDFVRTGSEEGMKVSICWDGEVRVR